jgi:hypothetical protein
MKNSVKNQRKQAIIKEGKFRVKYRSQVNTKVRLFPQKFDARKQARKFCWNRRNLYLSLWIVHPDGYDEPVYDDYGKKQ